MKRLRARWIKLRYKLTSTVLAAIFLWISYRYQLGTATQFAALLNTVIQVFLAADQAAHQFKRDRSDVASAQTLAKTADKLATKLSEQWESEWKLLGFTDQDSLLRVSWEAADDDLVDPWIKLVETAEFEPADPLANRFGWTSQSQSSGLNGSGVAEFRNLLSRVPTGRLIILGGRGAGKTILLLDLVRNLLKRRLSGDPVPVLVPLASWNPNKQTLYEWLDTTLTSAPNLSFLRECLADSEDDVGQVRLLLKDRRLLPILDGLDEMPSGFRGLAIAGINQLDLSHRLIVSSRLDEYQAVVHSPTGAGKLSNAAGIVLHALDVTDVEEYLCPDGDARARARWDPVFAALRTTAPIAQVFSTPLMVDLARKIYKPDPHKKGNLLNPADLVKNPDPPDVATIEGYLFDRFIEVAYRPPEASKPGPWRDENVKRWLKFLAQHQEKQADDKINFAWWELPSSSLVPRALVGVVVGSLSALATGLAAGFGSPVGSGFGLGLGAGIGLALAVGLSIYWLRRSREQPLAGLAYGLAGGLIGGLTAGMIGAHGIGYAPGPLGGLAGGIGVGVGAGPTSGRLGGFVGSLVGGLLAGTLAHVGSGLPAAIVNGLGVGLGAGLIAGLPKRRTPAQRVRWSPIGLIGGLAAGIAAGLTAGSEAGPDLGLVVGLAVGLASALASGLARDPVALKAAEGPNAVLSRDRRAFAVAGLSAAIATGLAAALLVGLAAADEEHVPITLNFVWVNGLGTGVAVGLVCGLVLAFVQTAWGSFAVARCWLAARGHLPLPLSRFLSDAHVHRGILRQFGARYQFHHLELQRHLAYGKDKETSQKLGHNITTKDFLRAPTVLDSSTYQLVQPSKDSVEQLYPYVDLERPPRFIRTPAREDRAEIYLHWWQLFPKGFMHLEKFVNGEWVPIAVSIIIPLSRDGYRAVTSPSEAKRTKVVNLAGKDIFSQPGTKKRFSPVKKQRFLLIDTWIVDMAYKSTGHGKTETDGGYANTLVLKHISVLLSSTGGFQRTTFLVETDNRFLAPMLESMTFSPPSKSKIGGAFYKTDTTTFESLDDFKFRQVKEVIEALEEVQLAREKEGTSPKPGHWEPHSHVVEI